MNKMLVVMFPDETAAYAGASALRRLDEEGSLTLYALGVIAEVEEEWIIPLDTAMEAAGGVVFRRARADVEEAQLDRDISAFKSEIAELNAEYREAGDVAKTRLQARLKIATAGLERAVQRAKLRLEEVEQEANSRVGTLERQFAKAQGDARNKLKDRAQRVRGGYDERSAKLSEAWRLAKEALTG